MNILRSRNLKRQMEGYGTTAQEIDRSREPKLGLYIGVLDKI